MIPGNVKTKEEKPLIADVICPFFEVDALKSIGDSMISLIMTEVRGAEVVLHRHSHKHLSQSCLYPIDIVLWLVLVCVLGRHRLASMQSFLRTTSVSIQIMPWSTKL